MAIEPDYASFAAAYDEGRPQAVFARRVADLDTPVSAYLKLAEGRDDAFLLESVQGGETRGRYSVVGLKPDLVWRCRDGKAEINRNARGAPDRFEAAEESARPFESLRLLLQSTWPFVWICRRHCRPWPSASSAIWVTTSSALSNDWGRRIPIRSTFPMPFCSVPRSQPYSTMCATRSRSSHRSGPRPV